MCWTKAKFSLHTLLLYYYRAAAVVNFAAGNNAGILGGGGISHTLFKVQSQEYKICNRAASRALGLQRWFIDTTPISDSDLVDHGMSGLEGCRSYGKTLWAVARVLGTAALAHLLLPQAHRPPPIRFRAACAPPLPPLGP